MAAEVEIVLNARDNASSVLGNFGSIITGIESAINLVGQAFDAAVGAITPFIDSASESEVAVAQLEAILRATGGAAGLTSVELQDLADGLQNVTRFSDETILGGASLMLTFRNIGEETMLRAIPAMLDMAEVFGSVDGAAMQLGKALNDPVNMMGALSRAGVTFSDAQKEAIKSMVEMGDLAGAQNIILAELEAQVGGTAEALGNTFAGSIEIAKNKLDSMREIIGGPIIFLLGELLGKIMEFADTNPVIQSVLGFFTTFNDLLRSDIDMPILSALGGAFLTLTDISPLFRDVAFTLIDMQNALNSGESPFEILSTGLESLAEAWEGSPLGDIVTRIQEFIATGQSEGWGQAFSELWSDIIESLHLDERLEFMLSAMTNRLIIWSQSGQAAALGETIAGFISNAIRTVLEGLDRTVGQVDFEPFMRALVSALWAALVGIADDLEVAGTNAVRNFFNGWEVSWTNSIRDFMNDLELGITDGVRDFFNNWEMNWTDWVRDHIVDPIKNALGIHSYSTVFIGIGRDLIGGLIGGIDSMLDNLRGIISDVVGIILDPFTGSGGVLGTSGTVTNGPGGLGGLSGYSTGGGLAGTGGLGSGTGSSGAGGTSGGNVLNFYGPVYVGSLSELTYDCSPTNPLLQASTSLGGSGIG